MVQRPTVTTAVRPAGLPVAHLEALLPPPPGVAAQGILVRITATAAEASNAIVACARKGLHLGQVG